VRKCPSKNNRCLSVVKMACLRSVDKPDVKDFVLEFTVNFCKSAKICGCRTAETKLLVLFGIGTTTDFSVCVKCKLHRMNFTIVNPISACPDELLLNLCKSDNRQ
jgi:hypothetical protein